VGLLSEGRDKGEKKKGKKEERKRRVTIIQFLLLPLGERDIPPQQITVFQADQMKQFS